MYSLENIRIALDALVNENRVTSISYGKYSPILPCEELKKEFSNTLLIIEKWTYKDFSERVMPVALQVDSEVFRLQVEPCLDKIFYFRNFESYRVYTIILGKELVNKSLIDCLEHGQISFIEGLSHVQPAMPLKEAFKNSENKSEFMKIVEKIVFNELKDLTVQLSRLERIA